MLKKQENRLRRKARVRSKISGTAKRPRLSIFRSNTNIYAQIIDDETGKTLAACSDLKGTSKIKRLDSASKVGEEVGKKAKALKIKEIVFDRGGFPYQGRVKALAEAARKAGLNF